MQSFDWSTPHNWNDDDDGADGADDTFVWVKNHKENSFWEKLLLS